MENMQGGDFPIHTPDYDGPNRRQHCYCHPKHDKVLKDHDEELKEMRRENKARDKDADEAHGKLWSNMDLLQREKVEKRLFYLLITSVFAVMAFVYMGIHKVDKNVAVLNANMQQHFTQAREIKEQIQRVDDKVEAHIHATSNGHTTHGGN